MTYPILLVVFASFTLLDALITVMGLRVGCVELNPLVTTWGIHLWVMFRITLLASMLSVFIFSHRFLTKHFPTRTRILEIALWILDFYISAIVFSGIFAVSLKLFV